MGKVLCLLLVAAVGFSGCGVGGGLGGLGGFTCDGLDQNGDGTVTVAEYRATVGEVFGDGFLDDMSITDADIQEALNILGC